jgi:hypothetical protein
VTTSVLMSHVGYLNDHDLQVLRDFALEAPDPWRNALNNLISAADELYREQELKEEVDELAGALLRARLDVLKCAAELARAKTLDAEGAFEVIDQMNAKLTEIASDMELKDDEKKEEKK